MKYISLRKVEEYSYEVNLKKPYHRVCKGNEKSEWICPKFINHIFLKSEKEFKEEINKIIK